MAEPQIPSKGHLPKARIQVLLLRANDLGFGAANLEISANLWPHHIWLLTLNPYPFVRHVATGAPIYTYNPFVDVRSWG